MVVFHAEIRESAQSAPSVEMIEAALSPLREEAATLRQRISDARAAIDAETERTRLLSQKVDAETDEHVLTMLRRSLGPGGLQGDILGQLTAPLHEHVDPILGTVWPEARFEVALTTPEGRSACEFGIRREGLGFTPLGALSTGETAVVGAAIAAGLAALTDVPHRHVMLDDMQVIDEWGNNRRRLLLAALAEAVAGGSLDQVTAAGVQGVESPPSAYRVLTMGAPKETK